MKLLIAKTLLLSGFSFSVINCHAEGNLLLNRDFWKENPSLEQVQNAVDEGHDPAQLDQYAFDALSWALIENSSIEIQTYLLNLPGNSVNKLTHDGRTYIFWAAYRNNLPFMEHLINAGAKTNIIDDHGYSLLNFAAVTGQTSIELFDFIIEHGADPILETNRNGANALLLLMPFLENDQLIKYFESKGLSLQDTDYDGSNAYHYASKGGNIDLLEKLEDKGLNPKKVNKKKMNAFHFASMGMRGHSNKIEVFNYLETKGVDPCQVSATGNTALTYYVTKSPSKQVVEYFISKDVPINQETENGYTALLNAAPRQNKQIISLLLERTYNINHQNKDGEFALALAIRYNDPEVVELLVQRGADLTLVNANGNGLLYFLMQSHNAKNINLFNQKVDLLRQAGFSFNHAEKTGKNLYHMAVEKGSHSLLSFAKNEGAEINTVDKDGLTPLHYAAMTTDNISVIHSLIKDGADKTILTDFQESAYDLAFENELLKKEDIDFLKI